MDINSFKKVYGDESLTFADIWKIYDSQFEVLRNFLIRLGDKFDTRTYSDSTSKEIELDDTYKFSSSNLFVYLNGSMQQKGVDYEIASNGKTLQLLFDREISDVITLVSVHSVFLEGNINTYISELEDFVNKSKEDVGKAESILNEINLVLSEITESSNKYQEISDTIGKQIVEIKGDLDKFSSVDDFYNKIEESSKNSEKNALRAESAKNDVESLKEDIDKLNLNTPDSVNDTEVTLARGGYNLLGDRLNRYIPYYKTKQDMQTDSSLKDGDTCLCFGSTEFDDEGAGFYSVVELSDDSSLGGKDYCILGAVPKTEGNVVYAYKLGKIV